MKRALSIAQVRRLFRRASGGKWGARRCGRLCVVGLRLRPHSCVIRDVGWGWTWEAALDDAIRYGGLAYA